jgi:hypothetical protein
MKSALCALWQYTVNLSTLPSQVLFFTLNKGYCVSYIPMAVTKCPRKSTSKNGRFWLMASVQGHLALLLRGCVVEEAAQLTAAGKHWASESPSKGTPAMTSHTS